MDAALYARIVKEIEIRLRELPSVKVLLDDTAGNAGLVNLIINTDTEPVFAGPQRVVQLDRNRQETALMISQQASVANVRVIVGEDAEALARFCDESRFHKVQRHLFPAELDQAFPALFIICFNSSRVTSANILLLVTSLYIWSKLSV